MEAVSERNVLSEVLPIIAVEKYLSPHTKAVSVFLRPRCCSSTTLGLAHAFSIQLAYEEVPHNDIVVLPQQRTCGFDGS
ncbi:unnamed protein product [Peronospora belbahrii]|uniref:Uncharacterized protein n=1 Tax=Peronospora belbahrii TaxID=622444 RepID=A0AAU9L5B5_9STRA|nr:unnamed protein product [Peronospora belbahrii]